jgi:prevent-host-death family protein
MEQIGVRELRQHASRWLRRVAAGETLEVTDRGRPVARLVPIPSDAPRLEQLLLEGRARPGVGNLLDLGAPLPPTPGEPLPSELLELEREDER